MKTKIQKSDFIFIAVLIVAALMHILCMFVPVPYNDEVLYPNLPLRFINGDSMIQHEWHLTQFSSLFSYLPVLVWVKIKGSTEGIIFFLRCVYLFIHTVTSGVIYTVFRKYKLWAVVAAALFYTNMAYRMLTISYISMVVVFLQFFCISLFFIYEKQSVKFYLFAGMAFAACCVCNPFYCIVYVIYIIACVVCKQKIMKPQEAYENLSSKQRKTAEMRAEKIIRLQKFYDAFCGKRAITLFTCGIGIVAAVSLFYFFATGGSVSSFVKGFGNLFSSTEYGMLATVFQKLTETAKWFNEISLHHPFLLPALYIALLLDVNRHKPNHKIIYLIASVIISLIYITGITYVFFDDYVDAYALSLPFGVFSSVCYILTENKNKRFFYCMWCPGAIGAIVQFLASNTLLTPFFAVFAVCHIPGVFLVRDFFSEFCYKEQSKSKKIQKHKNSANTVKCCGIVVCLALCLQISFNVCLYMYKRIPDRATDTKVTHGPMAELYLGEDYYNSYVNSLKDLDIIKSRSEKTDPVLITSHLGWMQLYVDRSLAAYSPCLLKIDTNLLTRYYQQNPDKIPKYIYIGFADTYYMASESTALYKVEVLQKMFDCTVEELSWGFLLTVNKML